jgi:hypothetical protein
MLRRIVITLVGAALGSVLIATGPSAAASDRHHRGHHVGYAGPVPSASPGISVPILRQTDRAWPEGHASYHGANGG